MKYHYYIAGVILIAFFILAAAAPPAAAQRGTAKVDNTPVTRPSKKQTVKPAPSTARKSAVKASGNSGQSSGRASAGNDSSVNTASSNSTSGTSKAASSPVLGGVLNGKAVSLPLPVYPAAARVARAGGVVNVKIVINENGDVESAAAVNGHPLLQAAAVDAARAAKFTPTRLDGHVVKVAGVIVYNFIAPK
jgi:TonB family protein